MDSISFEKRIYYYIPVRVTHAVIEKQKQKNRQKMWLQVLETKKTETINNLKKSKKEKILKNKESVIQYLGQL